MPLARSSSRFLHPVGHARFGHRFHFLNSHPTHRYRPLLTIAAQMGIGYVTVRSHVRNLSSKLDAHSKREILARAADLGLIAR